MRTILHYFRLKGLPPLTLTSLLIFCLPVWMQAQQPVCTLFTVDASCPEGNNGSVRADLKNGVAPYTYRWNTGSTTRELDDLAPGRYAVTVTDAAGVTCTASVQLQLIGGESLVVNQTESICKDEVATYTAEAGYQNYHWTLGNAADEIVSGQGTYSITVRWHSAGAKTVGAQFSKSRSTCSGSIEFHSQVESCTTETETPQAPEIKITPNPFDHKLAVQTADQNNAGFTLRLMDICGNTVRSQQFSGGEAEIETSGLPKGQYFLWYQDSRSALVKKIVKSR